jgi:ribulose-5-phosphate 4-epimerase/fuculose-1-phosphate aldolase
VIDQQFREEFLKLALDLENSALTGLGPGKGSISARDFDSNCILITPSGVKMSSLTPDDLLVLDINGEKINGAMKPSLDLVFHVAVYQARADVGGIVHTHSPYATAYACMGKSIQPVIMSLVVTAGGQVDVAPFAFPGTPELGANIVRALGDEKKAVLMEKHGVLAAGITLQNALNIAGTVENVAQIQYLIEGNGRLEPLDDHTIQCGMDFEKEYGQDN